MGMPFKIINPEDIPPGKSWMVSEEDLRQIEKQNEALVEIRGRVISYALINEDKLDDIICFIFFGKDGMKCSLFKELLLQKEFFTFMNKWKLFREFAQRKIINFEEEKLRKEVCSNIQKVIETRDIFAHGEIVFSGTKPQLHFTHMGQRKYVTLDNSYFDSINDLFNRTSFFLEDIYRFLRGERQQETLRKKEKKS